jgi:beta-phosphoglucomutase-like phosphatase (HAD superfamily)
MVVVEAAAADLAAARRAGVPVVMVVTPVVVVVVARQLPVVKVEVLHPLAQLDTPESNGSRMSIERNRNG